MYESFNQMTTACLVSSVLFILTCSAYSVQRAPDNREERFTRSGEVLLLGLFRQIKTLPTGHRAAMDIIGH